MIYFETPYLFEEGLVILGDHQDKTVFYYFPPAPKLAKHPDGLPVFLFLKYADSPEDLPAGVEGGGGFLAFDCDLHVEPDQVADAAKAVKKKLSLGFTPTLVPIDYRSGSVRLMLLDLDTSPPSPPPLPSGLAPVKSSIEPPPGMKFVERASFSATPSLFGENRATFNVELNQRGATLIEESLDMASSLVGIVYDLKFVGLKPGFNVKLKVDWKVIQHDVDERFQASIPFASVDIETFVSELIDKRKIEFEVIRLAAGSDDAALNDRTDEAVQFVKAMITEKFFEPSLNPREGISERWWEQAASFARSLHPTFTGYTKRDMTRIDLKSLDVSFREKSAVERRILPQGHLQGLANVLKGHARELFIKSVKLEDDFFKTIEVDVKVGGSYDALKFTGAKIEFDYASDLKSLTFDKTNDPPQTVKWSFETSARRNYRYRVQFFPGADMPDGLEEGFATGWMPSNETRIILDPIRYFQLATMNFRLMDETVLTRFPKIEIIAEHKDPAGQSVRQKSLMLRSDQKTVSWRFLPFASRDAVVSTRLRFTRPNGTTLDVGPIESKSDTLVIDDPQPLRLETEIVPSVDWAKFRQVLVALRYEDVENGLRLSGKTTFTEKSENSRWSVPIADIGKRRYSYQVTFITKTGAVRQWPFVSTEDEQLFVTEDFQRETIVGVSAKGKRFDQVGLARIELQFSYDPGDGQPVVTGEATLTNRDATAEFRFTQTDPSRSRYRYSATFVKTDGSRRFEPEREADSIALVFPIN